VLFLGRLVPVKGVATLIEAAARWRSDARLVIAGDGPDRARLAARVAQLSLGNVELVGEVVGEARDRLIADADLVVLPSVRVDRQRTEGLPVTALEAMAARVPLVASAVGGLAELPGDVLTRTLPDDAADLAAAIDRLLSDPQLRQQQVAAADAFVDQRDWSVIGPRLL
jgi:glycosyltransferase involved in cell wall biosynthesis